jgi:hypothetical protein
MRPPLLRGISSRRIQFIGGRGDVEGEGEEAEGRVGGGVDSHTARKREKERTREREIEKKRDLMDVKKDKIAHSNKK